MFRMRTIDLNRLNSISCPSVRQLTEEQKKRINENIERLNDSSIKKMRLDGEKSDEEESNKPKFQFGIPSRTPLKEVSRVFGPPPTTGFKVSPSPFPWGPRGRFKKALEHFKSKEVRLLDLKKNGKSNAKDQNKHFIRSFR